MDNTEDFNKYRDGNNELYMYSTDPLYQVIVEKDDGTEYTVTLDD